MNVMCIINTVIKFYVASVIFYILIQYYCINIEKLNFKQKVCFEDCIMSTWHVWQFVKQIAKKSKI